MSSFTDPLIVRVEQRERKGRALFTLVQEFHYFVGPEGSDYIISIRAGFETDFASIPRFARLFISPVGLHAKAALIHDALYRGKAELQGWRHPDFTRHKCDFVFREAMKILNVPFTRRWLMYLSVRAFGGYAFRKDARK